MTYREPGPPRSVRTDEDVKDLSVLRDHLRALVVVSESERLSIRDRCATMLALVQRMIEGGAR
jgi:hypothetical protein